MNFDELYNTGNEILGEVNHAINTGDYTDLSQSIRNLVADAIRGETGAGGQAGAAGQGGAPGQPGAPGRSYSFGDAGFDIRSKNARKVASYANTATFSSSGTRQTSRRRTPFFLKSVSKGRAILKTIMGALGTTFFSMIEFFVLIGTVAMFATEGFGMGLAALLIAGLFGVLLAISIVLIVQGKKEGELVERFYKYGKALGDAQFFSIKDLSEYVGVPQADLTSDIEAMIKKGFLPQARMDKNKTTVMLTDEAYAQYLAAEKGRISREAEQIRNEAAADVRNAQDDNLPQEVRELLTEGNRYMKVIREVNDEIPDTEVMSDKLYKLEGIMGKIFAQVEKDPGCASDLRKLMNYYLPTTEKLLRAYVDLDKQPDVGENIRGPKREIEATLDTINDAFEKLLDSLFRETAWDISSDISVMKTMMAQDGLTDDGTMSAGTGAPPQETQPEKPEGVQVQTSDGTIITLVP